MSSSLFHGKYALNMIQYPIWKKKELFNGHPKYIIKKIIPSQLKVQQALNIENSAKSFLNKWVNKENPIYTSGFK